MHRKQEVIDQLLKVWHRLAPIWGPYFERAGMSLSNVTRANLKSQLIDPIEVNFSAPGLKDLSPKCMRGVEPGDPALSLFYHALASPHVHPDGIESSPSSYPTMRDLEIVENFIYAAADMTLEELHRRAEGKELAIVVFAYEYAPARETIHKRHADLCFSRTGISRVGNKKPNYVYEARGYFPFVDDYPKRVHVVPARFGAFVAYQEKGNPATVGPHDFIKGDHRKTFWVPLHKLFSGEQCIRGFNLDLEFEVKHINEKIRRVHRALKSKLWSKKQMTTTPFVITEDIAEFDPTQGLMVPCPHNPIVSPAQTKAGRFVGFRVRRLNSNQIGESALWLRGKSKLGHAPEFVHMRYKIVRKRNGQEDLVYLPDETSGDIVERLKKGGFIAANFVDWTGDGYIKANCATLAEKLNGDKSESRSLAAYSIVAQPDFFPLVTQKEITDWWKSSANKHIIWSKGEGVAPHPLSQRRLSANIRLKGAGFDVGDTTVAGVVGIPRDEIATKVGNKTNGTAATPIMRQSTLSFRASGIFAPGWDVAESSTTKGIPFMANYGLGSPFLEDTLICSALGAFWPGAAPDITRFFAPNNEYPITTPLTDSEASWRAVKLPIKKKDETIAYQTLVYSDFVKAVYERRFEYGRFARLDLSEFILRTQVTALFYKYLQMTGALRNARSAVQRAVYLMTSFRRAEASELKNLPGWRSSSQESFRIEFARKRHSEPAGNNPRLTKVTVNELKTAFVGRSEAAGECNGKWRVITLK